MDAFVHASGDGFGNTAPLRSDTGAIDMDAISQVAHVTQGAGKLTRKEKKHAKREMKRRKKEAKKAEKEAKKTYSSIKSQLKDRDKDCTIGLKLPDVLHLEVPSAMGRLGCRPPCCL